MVTGGGHGVRRVEMLTGIDRRWLLALFGLALCVRVWGLGARPVWFDEIASLQLAEHRLPWETARGSCPRTVWEAAALEDVHGPAYFHLLALATRVGGTSEGWMRLPSAVLGALAVPLVGLLATWWGRPREGGWAAAFLALSPLHVAYSQEVRMYTLLVLVSGLYLMTTAPLTKGASPRSVWLARALSVAAILYVHPLGAFLVAAGETHLAWSRRCAGQPWGPQAISLAVAGLVYLPWLPALARQVASGHAWAPYRQLVTLETVPSILLTLAGGLQKTSFPWVAAVVGGLLLMGTVGMRSEAPLGLAAFAVWHAAAPLGLALALGAWKPFFYPRYSIIVIVPVALLAGVGLEHVRKRVRGAAITAGFLLSVTAIPLVFHYASHQNPAWDEAAAWIAQNEQEGDLILVQSQGRAGCLRYYFDGTSSIQGVGPAWAGPALRKLMEGHRRVWLVSCREWGPDPQHRVSKQLLQERTVLSFTRTAGIRIILFK